MPIPALQVKSPQSWKGKKKSYPSDKSIKKRRASFGVKKKTTKFKVPKRSTYFGKRDNGSNFKQKFLKPFIKYAIYGLIFVILFGATTFIYYSYKVPGKEEIRQAAHGTTTKIYDRTGEVVLYDLSGDYNKTWVPLDQIPEHVRWALISIEDDQFYSHRGFDIPALVKVFLHEAFGIGPQRGGSTITQQLVKNTLLTSERSYWRKIKELIISYHMEKKFNKDEILEMYFNAVPYGSTAYGIEAAAHTYFGKSAEELDLAEGATLAAMLKATTYYSPYGSHTDELLARKDFVLSQMVRLGYVSEEAASAAKEKELEFNKLSSSIKAPHYVLYIKELLAEEYGEELVEKGGLKVISSLDWEKQQIAEEAITAGVERNEVNYAAHNAALVSIDARTGEILAMVGSRDYFNEEYDGAVNVTMRPRQPGSSFKPIVFASSFIEGLSPDTILFDALTKFKTDVEGEYIPHNYDGEFHGPVSIRKALQGSLNVPAVKAIYLAGVDSVIDLAEDMGYSTLGDRSRFGLSLVLGGGEVKLTDHVKAFGVLAQEGVIHEPVYILKVEDIDGKVLEEFKPDEAKGEKVMDPEIAKMVNSVLSDDSARAYVFGLGSYLTLPGRAVAAKTGTTNDYRDGWTIGYTPSIVTGVWVGNNDNSAMKGSAAGGNVAAPIWNEYMRRSLEGSDVEGFSEYKKVDLPEKPMLNGKMGAENVVQIDRASGKLATSMTPPSFIEEKAFQELHSILHYVNKNNIKGPIPEHPERDDQYSSFEEGIIVWAEENEIEIKEELPTEYDDLHTEENRPTLSINSPANSARFNEPKLDVSVQVNTKRAISRIEYYIDNQLIKTENNWPYNLSNYQLVGFENGDHWLRAIAYDDIDNSREASVRIFLNLASEYSRPVVWLSPSDGDELYAEQFPYNLSVRINNHTLYSKVDFYLKRDSGSSSWIDYKDISSGEVSVALDEAESGDYSFYVILTSKNGQTVSDGGIRVRVVD
jgi:membrane peptidoglycan carboxypeptidase